MNMHLLIVLWLWAQVIAVIVSDAKWKQVSIDSYQKRSHLASHPRVDGLIHK